MDEMSNNKEMKNFNLLYENENSTKIDFSIKTFTFRTKKTEERKKWPNSLSIHTLLIAHRLNVHKNPVF